MDIKPQEKQEILETIDLALRMEKVSRHLAERIEVLRLSNEIGQQTRGDLRRAPARSDPPRADGDHSAPARRGRRQGPGSRGAERGHRQGRRCRPRRKARRERNFAATSACRKPPPRPAWSASYLDWLIELPWALPEEKTDRHRGGPANPRRGSLRSGEDQEPHHRISGRPKAGAARQGADSLLRRSARRRQDFAGPIHRARDGAAVRPRQPRWRS